MKSHKQKPWVKKSYKRRYTRAKAFSKGCRNHGTCKYCLSNRMHKYKKQDNAQ